MQFKSLLSLLLLTCLVSCGFSHSRASVPPSESAEHSVRESFNPTEMLVEARQATVALMEERDETWLPVCAGTWVNHNTIVTAYHCIVSEFSSDVPDGLLGSTVRYSVETDLKGLGKAPHAMRRARIAVVDVRHDLALLLAKNNEIPEHIWMRIGSAIPPVVGDSLFVIGHPAYLYYTVMSGTVAALRPSFFPHEDPEIEGPFIQIFSSIFEGNSGGPVVSNKGELLGVVSFIMPNVPNQGFAISATAVQNLLSNRN